jgi:uncharacterized membrane protein
LGWILEVIYHLYKNRHFVNRGFLYGPLCPIYGCGAVLLIAFLDKPTYNLAYVFLGGVIIGTVIELITGYIMELAFYTKWWDYSHEKYNIKGYVCLKFSLFWGVLAIILIRLINPGVSKGIHWIIGNLGEIFYSIILVPFIVDSVLTINSLITFRKLFVELQEILVELRDHIEKLKERKLALELREVLEGRISDLGVIRDSMLKRLSLKQRTLLNAYPRLNSKRFSIALEEIRRRLDKFKGARH